MNSENEHVFDEKAVEKGIERAIENWFERKFSGKEHDEHKWHKKNKMNKTNTGASTGLYFIGFIGAAIYYIGAATTFWVGVFGVLKAFVWPAFLVHGLLSFIGN